CVKRQSPLAVAACEIGAMAGSACRGRKLIARKITETAIYPQRMPKPRQENIVRKTLRPRSALISSSTYLICLDEVSPPAVASRIRPLVPRQNMPEAHGLR